MSDDQPSTGASTTAGISVLHKHLHARRLLSWVMLGSARYAAEKKGYRQQAAVVHVENCISLVAEHTGPCQD